MELQEVIKKRIGCRSFTDKPIPEQTLCDIVKDAQRAPSWANAQATHVYIATGESLKNIKADHLAKVEGGRYVLHRVIKIEDGLITLMGDGNIRGHEHTVPERVAGTVTRIIKASGREIKPGRGRVWKTLRPFRRIILGVYRRWLKVFGR